MNYIAVDLGAGSGRVILGTLHEGKLTLQEVHRFGNQPIKIGSSFHWNLPSLLVEIKAGIAKAAQEVGEIAGIGIDTWGVDYGLVDRKGNIIGVPYSYRDGRTEDIMEECFKLCSSEEIYRLTGNQLMNFNTAFQLFSQVHGEDPQLEIADSLLFMPDLFNYLLTGKKANEYTIASTAQMMHAGDKVWSDELFSKLKLPRKLMQQIVYPGDVIGQLSDDIASELGCKPIDVIAVGSHDTASAIAAVPADSAKKWAYLSSGTWSLMGVECDTPILNEKAYQNNFTNEGAVGGKIRFLKNITGFWILQQLVHEWKKSGEKVDIDSLVKGAGELHAGGIIDVDAADFKNPASMSQAIQNYLVKTGQQSLSSKEQFVRCLVDSLAAKYREVLSSLEDVTETVIERLHIIGGGSQNRLLNQLTANILGVEVVAGPIEATAMGNIMVQAIAKGEIASLEEGREIIKQSVELNVFYPKKS